MSFATNTNWQGYGGESTMSYLTQMLGLTVQNFVSAATGMAVLVALIRGFARKQARRIGNFWVDLVRSTVYILLPLSLVLALALVCQGVVQTFAKYATVTLVQPVTYDAPKNGPDGQPLKDDKGNAVTEKTTATEQTIPLGPGRVADRDQAARHQRRRLLQRQLRASVREPDAAVELPGSAGDPADPGGALLHVRQDDRRHAAGLGAARRDDDRVRRAARGGVRAGGAGQPGRSRSSASTRSASATNPGGNMEGKEARFGVANSALWAVATTAASNGSVNAMHDSLMPLAGMVPMWLMQLGEVIFGGVGSGLYGMIVFAIVAVFIAGLMVGRTPEYLGKKIGAFEIKMASIAILMPPFLVLVRHGARGACSTPAGPASPIPAEHGFSEILYAFSSAGNNNGSAFAGLSANTPFYNTALGIAMLFARYWLAIPVLALAGALAAAKHVPPSAGTLPTHTPLFVVVLIGTVITVGALTFVPALALGPVVEHLHAVQRPMTAPVDIRGMTMATLAAKQSALSWFLNRDLMKHALVDSFRRLTPRYQWRNPVMFVVYVGSILTTILWLQALLGKGEAPAGFILAITLWLWATLLFANFAEAIAEGRSKAQAASLKSARKDTVAKKLARRRARRACDARRRRAPAAQGRRRARRAGRSRPGRRRGDRRRGVDQRKRGHRRERAGDPRGGQRLQHGHRRHRRAVGLDHRAHQRQPGRGVPRPDDRHGRRREAAEDAERDRADDPAGRDDARVPARDRHAAARSRSTASTSRRRARRCRSRCSSRCSCA